MWALGLLLAMRSRRVRAFKRRIFGTLRVAAYVSVVGGSTLAVLSARANAELREQSLSLSQELLPIADLLQDATALRLNGERINFSMTVVENTSVKQVLDRVQAQCEKNPGPLARQSLALLKGLPESLPGSAALGKLMSELVVSRQESNGQGAVLCFSGDGSPADPEFADKFVETRDLNALGKLRYVTAGQGSAAQGEQHTTRVISLWTEGQFRLENLAPPDSGDAPGSDSALMPRPPRSARIFSAETVGAPYAVRVYETDAPAAEVLAFYDVRMTAHSQFTMAGYEQTARAYIKNAQPLLLQLTQRDSKTVVTLSEVGAAADLEKVKRVER
jgi:hypothetical protein